MLIMIIEETGTITKKFGDKLVELDIQKDFRWHR